MEKTRVTGSGSLECWLPTRNKPHCDAPPAYHAILTVKVYFLPMADGFPQYGRTRRTALPEVLWVPGNHAAISRSCET
jgi:hypothetical protein